MLTTALYILLALTTFEPAPKRQAPRASEPRTFASEELKATPDAPCFIFINEAGDVAETCP
jgi:hypothetical protein